MKKKKESLVLGAMLQKIAQTIEASVVIEPKWGIVGQITFKSGKRSYFRYNSLDLNSMGSSEIAKDKGFSSYFMESMGYKVVPDSKSFYSKKWGEAIGAPSKNIEAAYKHAKKIGFPVIVKPNSGSQGVGVSVVHNKREFYKSLRAIFKNDRVALVQRPVSGKDYRIVILDDEIISAYERIPLSVVGDGKATIGKLLKNKQKNFSASSRDTKINLEDPRIKDKLKHQELGFKSVLKKGEKVFLLDNTNLSSGGDSVDVTETVHPEFKDLAVRLTGDMGLRLCGVDIMVSGDISKEPNDYWILEINSAPGLDHYVKEGRAQEKVVEDLYLKVLKHMER